MRRIKMHIMIALMSQDVRRMVGDNVRRLRIAAGLTQAKLADAMGVDSLPTSSIRVPVGSDWVHEIKHDGYRHVIRRKLRDNE